MLRQGEVVIYLPSLVLETALSPDALHLPVLSYPMKPRRQMPHLRNPLFALLLQLMRALRLEGPTPWWCPQIAWNIGLTFDAARDTSDAAFAGVTASTVTPWWLPPLTLVHSLGLVLWTWVTTGPPPLPEVLQTGNVLCRVVTWIEVWQVLMVSAPRILMVKVTVLLELQSSFSVVSTLFLVATLRFAWWFPRVTAWTPPYNLSLMWWILLLLGLVVTPVTTRLIPLSLRLTTLLTTCTVPLIRVPNSLKPNPVLPAKGPLIQSSRPTVSRWYELQG